MTGRVEEHAGAASLLELISISWSYSSIETTNYILNSPDDTVKPSDTRASRIKNRIERRSSIAMTIPCSRSPRHGTSHRATKSPSKRLPKAPMFSSMESSSVAPPAKSSAAASSTTRTSTAFRATTTACLWRRPMRSSRSSSPRRRASSSGATVAPRGARASATMCGGSDATSGIGSNPAVGKLTKAEAYGFSDIAVDHVCRFV